MSGARLVCPAAPPTPQCTFANLFFQNWPLPHPSLARSLTSLPYPAPLLFTMSRRSNSISVVCRSRFSSPHSPRHLFDLEPFTPILPREYCIAHVHVGVWRVGCETERASSSIPPLALPRLARLDAGLRANYAVQTTLRRASTRPYSSVHPTDHGKSGK